MHFTILFRHSILLLASLLILLNCSFAQSSADTTKQRRVIPKEKQLAQKSVQEEIVMAVVKNNSLASFCTGYIDLKGNYILEPKFNEAQGFREDFAGVREIDKWGFIRRGSTKMIPPQFGMVRPFKNNLAAARTGIAVEGGWGFIDTLGVYVIPSAYLDAGDFSEGLAATLIQANTLTGKWGYIDRRGKVIILHEYDSADPFQNGIARVSKSGNIGGEWGYIDKAGKVVIPFIYTQIGNFRNQLAPACTGRGLRGLTTGGHWAYINTKGEEVITKQFDAARDFSNGLAAVKKLNNMIPAWGFIDTTGTVVIPYSYMDVKDFCDGVVAFKDKGRWGLMDSKGKVIQEAFYQDIIFPFTHGLIPAKSNNKWGYINTKGEWVIQPQWAKVDVFY